MAWDNPFSFRGEIGRARMWFTLFGVTILGVATELLPVSQQTLLLSTYGGYGRSTISYFTPLEPITLQNWAWLAVSYALVGVLFWLLAAAAVRRLHDLGRSGKWVGYFFAGFVASSLLEAAFARPGAPLSTFDIVSMVLFVPFYAIGTWGFFEMLFIRGYRDRRTAVRDADMRQT